MGEPIMNKQANTDAWRRKLYSDHAKQTWTDIQSSTDSFDKSLLTISSGALGLSLAFIKDIVPLSQAVWLPSLYISWAAFVICILVTVFSFRLSVAALNEHLGHLQKYYLDEKQEYLNMKSCYSMLLTVFTWAAAISFLAGVVSTVLFCFVNVWRNH